MYAVGNSMPTCPVAKELTRTLSNCRHRFHYHYHFRYPELYLIEWISFESIRVVRSYQFQFWTEARVLPRTPLPMWIGRRTVGSALALAGLYRSCPADP